MPKSDPQFMTQVTALILVKAHNTKSLIVSNATSVTGDFVHPEETQKEQNTRREVDDPAGTCWCG